LGQAYIEKNPLAALQAFAIASGWEQSSFMKRHFLGRALVRITAFLLHAKLQQVETTLVQIKVQAIVVYGTCQTGNQSCS